MDEKPGTKTPKMTENADDKSAEKATNEKPKGVDGSDKDDRVVGPARGTSRDDDKQIELSKTNLLDCGTKPSEQQYAELRMTAKTLSYFINNRDREKVAKWIAKLDSMKNNEKDRLERLMYARYLVSTLTGSIGLVWPFVSAPPNEVKKLAEILAPPVYADLIKDSEADIAKELCLAKRSGNKRPPKQHHPDSKFFREQLYPPEGLMCYAAAFRGIP